MVLVSMDIVPKVHHESFEEVEVRENLRHKEAVHANFNLHFSMFYVPRDWLLHLGQHVHVGVSHLAGLLGFRSGELFRLDLTPLGGFKIALPHMPQQEASC